MADLAQLGLTVDGNGAVQKLKEFSGVSDKAGQSTDALTAKLKQQDQALRALAERGTIASDTGKRMAQSIIAQNGGMERYLQIQRQIAQEMRVADEVAKQHSATMMKLNATTDGGHLAVGRLRQGLSSLAAQVTGLNPQIASLTSVLGSFALGSGPLVAILAGIAAISYAYNKLTSDTRRAKEETERFIESLRRSAQAAKDATVSGAEARAGQARQLEAEAKAAQRRFNETGGGPSWQANLVTGRVTQATSDRILAEANAAKVLAAANKDIVDAAMASDRAMSEFKDSAIKGLQNIDDARQRSADKAKRLHDQELADMERRARLAGQFAAEEEARTARLGKAWADLIRARHEAATERLGLPSGDDLQRDIKRNVEDALAREAADKKYAADMQAIWKQGLAKILTDGTKSFRDFFDDVLQMFNKLMKRMEDAGKTGGIGYKMLGIGSAAIGGALAGYQVGQAAGGATLGALGGAAAGAAFGAQYGPMGAVIGGLAGFATGLIGGSSAAAAHAKALRDAMAVFKESMKSFAVSAAGMENSFAEQVRKIQRNADALRTEAGDRYRPNAWGTGPGPRAAYAKDMADIAANEALYIERLKEEQRIKNQQFKEDLQVRLLRARGQEDAANDLAFKQQQARELAALDEQIRLGLADAGTRALLLQVQAAELLKKSVDALTTSVRNAPSGFKIESYINRYAAPRPRPFIEPPLDMPYNPGRPPMPYPKGGTTSGGGGTTINIGTLTMPIPPGMAPEKVGPAFMTYIRKVQLQTVGPNAPLADAMEYAS